MNMNICNLINSNAVSEHCKTIEYQFNIEEAAILIFRSKKVDIAEKISLYEELIADYTDIQTTDFNLSQRYKGVKEIIKEEINRLKQLQERLYKNEENAIYTYCIYNKKVSNFKYFSEFTNTVGSFEELKKEIMRDQEIKSSNTPFTYIISKRLLNEDNRKIISAEYVIYNQKRLLVQIYDKSKLAIPSLRCISLNIPTPFKKGDILINNYKQSLLTNIRNTLSIAIAEDKLYQSNDIFIVESINDKTSYRIRNDKIVLTTLEDADSLEYFDGKLEGVDRILNVVSNYLKGKVSIDTLMNLYVQMKNNKKNSFINYSDIDLQNAGLTEDDIEEFQEADQKINTIIRIVAEYFNLDVRALKNPPAESEEFGYARRIAMYLCVNEDVDSVVGIARKFNTYGRYVLEISEIIEKEMKNEDSNTRKDIEQLKSIIKFLKLKRT